MAGETPDYQRLNVQTTVFPMTDLGELAARLGSIVTFDRRGDVIYLDDFENGLAGFLVSVSGAGATIDLSTARKRSGQFSCRMVSGTGGAQLCELDRGLPLPALSALGVEISWSTDSGTPRVELQFVYDDGTDLWQFALRYDYNTNLLAVLNPAGAYETVASGLDVGTGIARWSTMKLVVGLVSLGYVRGLINGRTFDLSSFAPRDIGASLAPDAAAVVLFTGQGGVSSTAYFDDLVVTQNEPP